VLRILALQVPLPNWPVTGNYIPVGLLFGIHILIAEYSLGAITLASAMEVWALRSGEQRHLRYARSLGNSYYLVFSLGATFGIFAVTAIIGLWGQVWGVLMNRFFVTVAIAFGLFLVLAPLLVWWRNTFGTMRAGRHALLGLAVLFWQTLFMVLIVELDAFNITPARTGLLPSTLNPAYIPLLIHRLIGNVSWTALLLAGFAVLRMRYAADEGERWFQSWAARVNLRIGVVTAVAMPLAGFALVETLKQTQPGFFANLVTGEAAYLFILQAALLGILFVGSNVALAWESPTARGPDLLGRAAVGLALIGFVAGVLPSQVFTGNSYWIRYAGIGLGTLVTLLHVLARTTPRRQRLALQAAPAPGAQAVLPFGASALARRALVVVGITAMGLSVYMGFMKEEARNPYAIYGELTQQQAHGQWNPQGIYP
jgi:cytochrome bd-type quinol oxidase subunit 1